MATDTLATADAIMKDLYSGPIREQTNYRTWMLDKIERDSTKVDAEGRKASMPLHTGQNPSEGSIPDGGTLPTPENEENARADVYIKHVTSGVELTDKLIKLGRSDRGAFANVLEDRSTRLAKAFRRKINRQIFGDGIGTLATLASSPAGATTFTVDSVQYLRLRQTVDVRTKATGALENAGNVSLRITNINPTTKVVTVSGNVTATTGTAGVYIAGSYGEEIEGLRRIGSANRTLYGINSATAGNEYWNAQVKALGGAQAGEATFMELDDATANAGDDGPIDVWLTTFGVRRRLALQFQAMRQLNDGRAMKIEGGYEAIFVNSKPVIADNDAPKGWAFGLPNDAFTWFQVGEPDWLEDPKNGQIWHLANGSVAGTKAAKWQAWWNWYANLGADAPNRIAAISGAEDDA